MDVINANISNNAWMTMRYSGLHMSHTLAGEWIACGTYYSLMYRQKSIE